MTNFFQRTSPARRLALAGTMTTLLVGLAACGGGSDSTKGDDEATAKGATLQSIQDEGVITVGTEGTYPPFTFHEGGSGDLTGYDVEVTEAVAEELGVDVQFEETQWDAIFAGLEAGRFDVVANQVSINADRKEDYDFSTPYTFSKGVIVVLEGNDEISSFEDLDGKTTAQSLTSNWFELAKDNGADVEAVEGWAQAVELLRQGRVDATVNDELTFFDYESTEGGDTGLEIAARTDDAARNAFAFRKGSDDLVKAVDDALAKLREDGTLAEISQKYFGTDVSR
ncbi:MAG TPA: amino acid ABC transporter substrate-binding protein [Marmoricola sp.]|nr:amino acid ABC transporter substrate-binding protein [Marmoricola sp.]